MFTQSCEVALMETLGILLLLMKSLRLRLGLTELESFTDTTGGEGGKKFWIVGFFGLLVLLPLDDIVLEVAVHLLEERRGSLSDIWCYWAVQCLVATH